MWSNDIYACILLCFESDNCDNCYIFGMSFRPWRCICQQNVLHLFVYFRSHLFLLWSCQEYGRFPKVLRWAHVRKCLLFTKLGAWCRGHTTRLRLESHPTTSVCPTFHTLREKISQWQSREQLLLMDLFYKHKQLTVQLRGQWEISSKSQVVRTFCGAWQSKDVTNHSICSYGGFVLHYFSRFHH